MLVAMAPLEQRTDLEAAEVQPQAPLGLALLARLEQ
jgi:hypothetical protein